jgi:hypothetical protein
LQQRNLGSQEYDTVLGGILVLATHVVLVSAVVMAEIAGTARVS